MMNFLLKWPPFSRSRNVMPLLTSAYRPTLVQDMLRWSYSLLLTLLIPFAFASLLVKAAIRSKSYNRRRFERFGFIPRAPKAGGILLHCVSVGEVVAATGLIKKIQTLQPDLQITITTTTPTGSDRVKQTFGDSVHHFYLPFDLHMAMAGMLSRVKPSQVLIMEVELWPNLIHACWKKGIPVSVINARMTDRSVKGYQRLNMLAAPMLHKLHQVCTQGQRDYDNYLQLGINPEKLHLTNNIKFDLEIPEKTLLRADTLAQYGLANRRILIAGSTHEPEEAILLDAYKKLKTEFADLLLVLVPRHPHRFDLVAQLCQKQRLTLCRTSAQQPCNAGSDILLADEMGLLARLYAVADIAFVGGSLALRGGHNALEPAALAVPILMGPSQHNNPQICQILKQAGALKNVTDSQHIIMQARNWLTNPSGMQQAGEAGLAVLKANRGAIDATLACLFKLT